MFHTISFPTSTENQSIDHDLNETVAVALISGVVGITGTLMATFIATRHQERMASSQRDEDRLKDLRLVLSELFDAARPWVRTEELWIPIFGHFESMPEAQKFWEETLETDSGKSFAASQEKIASRLYQAALIGGDLQLADLIEETRTRFSAFGEKVNSPFWQRLRGRSSKSQDDLIIDGLRYLYGIRDLFTAIEVRAAEISRQASVAKR